MFSYFERIKQSDGRLQSAQTFAKEKNFLLVFTAGFLGWNINCSGDPTMPEIVEGEKNFAQWKNSYCLALLNKFFPCAYFQKIFDQKNFKLVHENCSHQTFCGGPHRTACKGKRVQLQTIVFHRCGNLLHKLPNKLFIVKFLLKSVKLLLCGVLTPAAPAKNSWRIFFFHFDVSCYKVVLLARPIFKLLSNQESQSDFSSCQNNIPRANSANQTFREEHSSEAFLWDQDQCWTEIHRKDTGNARSDAVGSIPFYWSVVEALGPRMYAKKKFAQPWIFGSVQWKGTILFSLTIPEPRFEHKFCDAINWEGNECFLLCFLRDINKVSHSKRISQHIFLSSLKTSLFVFVVLEAWMWQDSLQEFSYVLVRTRVNKYQPKKKTPHTPQFMSLNIKQHWRSHYHSSVDVDFLQSNVWR